MPRHLNLSRVNRGASVSKAKRLKQIETTLTPKQSVLLWLKETQQMGLVAYTEKQFTSPMCEAPKTRLTEMVGKAVYERQIKQGIAPTIAMNFAREARNQTDFLVLLVIELHKDVHLECTLNEPYILLLNEKFERMLEHFVLQDKSELAAWERWRRVLTERLRSLWRLRGTVGALSERYFDLNPLLFPEDASSLDEHIRALEELVNHCNRLKGELPSWSAIELDPLASSVHDQITPEVAARVANAKSTTLAASGEVEAGWKLVQPYALATLQQLRASTQKSKETS